MNSPPNPPSLSILENQLTLDDIFQTACDLSPARRSAYLDEACGENESMRREVEELLRFYETNEAFLENPAYQDFAQELAASRSLSPPPASQPMIGRQLENYRILAKLGKGGMGEVYLARDLELEIDVVIKFLREEFKDDPEWQARFSREGRLNAELKHPNIAGIHHKGEFDGQQFLVFEYVTGETLESRLDRGPLPIKEALPLFKQLADALAFAHRKGIIHRDLKPSNLMITAEGNLKVLDFGIAKRVSVDLTTVDVASATGQLTRDFGETRKGEVIGTVVYMSPEQTRGETLDQRTDIWSFAAVFYEALTCQRPFKGVDTYDTLSLIRNPKQQPDWRILPPKTPKTIQSLLRRCFEKDASRRLASTDGVFQIIQKAEAALLAGPFSFWPKHFKQQVAFVSTVLVLLLAAFAAGSKVWNWYFDPIPKVKYLAILPFKDTGSQAQEQKIGGGLAKGLSDILNQVPELKLLPYSAVARTYSERSKAAAEMTPSRALQSLGTNLILSGEVKRSGDAIEIEYRVLNAKQKVIKSSKLSGTVDQFRLLETRLAKEVMTALNIPPREFRDRVELPNPRDEVSLSKAVSDLQGDLSAQQLEDVIALLKNLIDLNGGPARVQATLAQAYLRHYTVTRKTESLDEALKSCEKAMQLDDGKDDVEVKVARGEVLTALDKIQDAITVFKEALAKQPDHPEALMGLAAAYDVYEAADDDQTDYRQKAEDAYRQAITAWPGYWAPHNELGVLYFSQSRYEQALSEWQTVLQLLPESYSGQVNAANANFKLGRWDEAENLYRRLVSQSQDSVEALAGLGTTQFYRKHYEDAAQSFLQATEHNPNAVTPWGNLGDAYRMLAGRESNSVESYDKAIARLQARMRGNSQEVTEYKTKLAELYAKRSVVQKDDETKAQDDMNRALDIAQRIAADRKLEDVGVMTSLVLVYHLAGRDDDAARWTEQALAKQADVSEFELNPEFESLRISNVKFQEALRKHRTQ